MSALSQPVVNILAIQPTSSQTIRTLYETALGQWTGCHWQTVFGPLRLDLQGVRASQAHLLAEATSGDEASAWEMAKGWLDQVEADAITAETCGQKTVTLVVEGFRYVALAEAEKAVALEAKYRDPVAWIPLRDAIIVS